MERSQRVIALLGQRVSEAMVTASHQRRQVIARAVVLGRLLDDDPVAVVEAQSASRFRFYPRSQPLFVAGCGLTATASARAARSWN